MKRIKGVTFGTLNLLFTTDIPFGAINLGALRLEREGRTFELDTVTSSWYTEDIDGTEVVITLEVDEDLSKGCKFDLTKEDLLSPDLKCELWLEEAIELSQGKYTKPVKMYWEVRVDDKEIEIPVTFE